jgi:hypothetical protein
MGITDDNLRKAWKSFTRARPFWHRPNCLAHAGSGALSKVQRAGASVAKIRKRVLVVDESLTLREIKHDKPSTSLRRHCVIVMRKQG